MRTAINTHEHGFAEGQGSISTQYAQYVAENERIRLKILYRLFSRGIITTKDKSFVVQRNFPHIPEYSPISSASLPTRRNHYNLICHAKGQLCLYA